ncbi:hypothetical protein ABFT80_07555 [Mesorhizobium sp. SB112]|uniref:hypothetical protein n=1 Tax=Mesorhizobium sp. SB112 TaxID=3151853 RepID=UPI003265C9CF
MSDLKRKISYGRILYAIFGIIISAFLGYYFSDRLENKADALSYIATVFSILAGVIIAIISILGEPTMILESSWRKDFIAARETQRKLHRHTDIFILYVILLAFLFVFSLSQQNDKYYKYIQFVCFFLTCFSFWISLSLPSSLKEIQKKRMEDAISAKKTAS